MMMAMVITLVMLPAGFMPVQLLRDMLPIKPTTARMITIQINTILMMTMMEMHVMMSWISVMP